MSPSPKCTEGSGYVIALKTTALHLIKISAVNYCMIWQCREVYRIIACIGTQGTVISPTIREELRKVTRQIVQQFHPQKVILFGSYAYGQPTEDKMWTC